MVIQFSPEQEALLKEVAARTQRTPEQIVSDALDAALGHDAWFRSKVQEGVESAGRGGLLPHEDVVRRIHERFGA